MCLVQIPAAYYRMETKQFSLFPPCNKSYVLNSDVIVEKFCSKISLLRADLHQKKKAVSCQADTEGSKSYCLAHTLPWRHPSEALSLRKRPSTRCTGGCVGLGSAGLDGFGKFHSQRGWNPGPSSPTSNCMKFSYYQ
jgi:hypothetical protein